MPHGLLVGSVESVESSVPAALTVACVEGVPAALLEDALGDKLLSREVCAEAEAL